MKQVPFPIKFIFFKTLSCMSLKFYKNGMMVQDSPLRLYNDPRTTSFIRDILDGYFPSELQEAYPNGVPFKVKMIMTNTPIRLYHNFYILLFRSKIIDRKYTQTMLMFFLARVID